MKHSASVFIGNSGKTSNIDFSQSLDYDTAKRTRYLRWADGDLPRFEKELTFERILVDN